jgi:putative peptidoglycan lipid II flippase
LLQSNKAVKTVIVMVMLSIVTKGLGFIRDSLIAAKFGSGVVSDTFFIALTATTMFSTIITQSLNITLIPILSEINTKEGGTKKRVYTNNFLNLTLILSLILMIIGWFLAPFVIKILASGFNGEQFELAVLLMRIGLPVLVFSGIVGVFRGYLQSELRFIESAVSELPFNAVYIIFLIFLSGLFGIKGLMVASVVAVAVKILVQIPGLKKMGFRYRFVLNIKDQYVKKISLLVIPVLISLGVDDINKIVDRTLATNLEKGSVSALNYGDKLNILILGIFITAISTVLFPKLSEQANQDSFEGFKRTIINGVNIILLITIPATVGMILLAEPIVRVAFERGAFNSQATYMTSGAFLFYSIGLAGMGLKTFLIRAYYSLQDTKTPMVNGFIAVGFNIIFSLILVNFMEHEGLALATSLSALITTGLLLFGLKKKIGDIYFTPVINCAVKSLFATSIMAVVIYYIYNKINIILTNNFLILVLVFIIGLFIYLILVIVLKVEELKWFLNLIQKKLKKGKYSI